MEARSPGILETLDMDTRSPGIIETPGSVSAVGSADTAAQPTNSPSPGFAMPGNAILPDNKG